MSDAILSSLPELRPDSGITIDHAVLCHINNCLKWGSSFQLTKTAVGQGGLGIIHVLADGVTLPQKGKVSRILHRLPESSEDNMLMKNINDALLGGKDYPWTTMASGIAAGFVSTGAGILFALASTALSASKKTTRILARPNDEIRQIEEIGKVGSDVVHVGSYWLNDPFRQRQWLIHEERTTITMQ
jgi:hypothetical protein